MFRKDVDFEAFERVMVDAASGNPSASCRTAFGTHGSSRSPATEQEPSRERYQRVAACGSGGGKLWELHSHRYSVPMGKTNRVRVSVPTWRISTRRASRIEE